MAGCGAHQLAYFPLNLIVIEIVKSARGNLYQISQFDDSASLGSMHEGVSKGGEDTRPRRLFMYAFFFV
jgi:hypothetical protein